MSGSIPVGTTTLPDAFARYHLHCFGRPEHDRSPGWQRREKIALHRMVQVFCTGQLDAEIYAKGEARRKLLREGWAADRFAPLLFVTGVIDEGYHAWREWKGETPFVDTAKFEAWLAGRRSFASVSRVDTPLAAADRDVHGGSTKHDRVGSVIRQLFPEGVPTKDQMSGTQLVKLVADFMDKRAKADPKYGKAPGRDTILRRAGRRRD